MAEDSMKDNIMVTPQTPEQVNNGNTSRAGKLAHPKRRAASAAKSSTAKRQRPSKLLSPGQDTDSRSQKPTDAAQLAPSSDETQGASWRDFQSAPAVPDSPQRATVSTSLADASAKTRDQDKDNGLEVLQVEAPKTSTVPGAHNRTPSRQVSSTEQGPSAPHSDGRLTHNSPLLEAGSNPASISRVSASLDSTDETPEEPDLSTVTTDIDSASRMISDLERKIEDLEQSETVLNQQWKSIEVPGGGSDLVGDENTTESGHDSGLERLMQSYAEKAELLAQLLASRAASRAKLPGLRSSVTSVRQSRTSLLEAQRVFTEAQKAFGEARKALGEARKALQSTVWHTSQQG